MRGNSHFTVVSYFLAVFSAVLVLPTLNALVHGYFLDAAVLLVVVAGVAAFARYTYILGAAFRREARVESVVPVPTPKVKVVSFLNYPHPPEEFAKLTRPNMFAILRNQYPEASVRMSHAKKADLIAAYTAAYTRVRIEQEMKAAVSAQPPGHYLSITTSETPDA
jgi:hypothetical protein